MSLLAPAPGPRANRDVFNEDAPQAGADGAEEDEAPDAIDVAFLANQARRANAFRRDGLFTDVTVRVGDACFPCHKVQLCAASDFFRALFASPMRDAATGDVVLEEMPADAVAEVLDFVASGACALTPANVVPVLAASDRLAVVELRERCSRYLQRHLCVDNAVGAFDLGHSLALPRLREAALRVALEQFEALALHESFLGAPLALVEPVLASDELRAREETVFEALSRWTAHDPDRRTAAATELLPLVRMPLCAPCFLSARVETDPLFQLPACQELLLEAYEHLNIPRDLQRMQQLCHPRGTRADWPFFRAVFSEIFGPRPPALQPGGAAQPGPELPDELGAEAAAPGPGGALRRAKGLQACGTRRRRRLALPNDSTMTPALRAHVRTIKSVCVDESRGWLYTGSWDHTANKWGIHTGVCLLTFEGHKQDIIGMHLSRDKDRLFTCADRVRCWCVHDGACLVAYGSSTFYCAITSPLALFAGQYDGQILVFDLDGPEGLGASAPILRGSRGAAPRAPRAEVRNPSRVFAGHLSGVMAFDLRGDLLVSASIDTFARAWSVESGACTARFVGHNAQLRAVQIWRDTVITGAYDHTVRQWDLESGALLRVFQGHSDVIRALVVGVDVMSCYLWSASSDGSVRQWDLETGSQVHRIAAHRDGVFALAHADGVLYTGSADNTAKRFDLHTGHCVMTFPRETGAHASGRGVPGPASPLWPLHQ